MAVEILGSDFQWVSRENDVLMKVRSPIYGEFLILTELQLRYTDKMPLRMRAYAALAQEKYGLPVYPVLVNILQPSETTIVRDRFESNFLGLQARQDFCVINLWEVDADIVFEQSLDTLLPFVPVLKDGGNEQTVRRALVQLQQNEQLVELESLLGFFASFVLDTELVRQIMRWDVTVLRESPWYQEIRQEGRLEDELRGRTEEARSLILRQLARRVGTLPAEAEAQVQALALPQLEALGEALLDFAGLDDLVGWLSQR
ncbi:Rpn family recombination-promoting nuclease/putative transposase [Altericista sp. CCNU0014]|uniref:Rpn family recombination-promoting nuclease/putative transposase n=1 Tax=Altericista sp. CCNU0014 TaxID=3082949 RepID=UPI00384DE545